MQLIYKHNDYDEYAKRDNNITICNNKSISASYAFIDNWYVIMNEIMVAMHFYFCTVVFIYFVNWTFESIYSFYNHEQHEI